MVTITSPTSIHTVVQSQENKTLYQCMLCNGIHRTIRSAKDHEMKVKAFGKCPRTSRPRGTAVSQSIALNRSQLKKKRWLAQVTEEEAQQEQRKLMKRLNKEIYGIAETKDAEEGVAEVEASV